MIASNTEHERQAVLADLRPQQLAVRRQLATLARRIRSYLVCQSLACVLGISAAVCFATLALDWLFRPALATRMSLAIPMAIVIFVFAIRRLSRPLRMRLDDLDLANLLDRHQPGLGQRVANVLQLPELLGSRLDSSTSLIRSAVINDVSVIKNVPFDSLLDRRRLVQALLIITASIALPLAFYFASPAMSQLWIKRWLLAQTIRWPQQTYLSIVGLDEGNRILVPRNEPLLLRVEAQKPFARHGDQWHLTGRGELLSLRQQEQPSSQSPDEVTLRYQSTSGEKQQAVFNRISPSRFHYELPAVTENVELTISADESWRGPEDWIGPIHVVPIDRPTVDRLTLTVQSPLLKTPEVFTYEQGDWQQLFLPETKFKLEIRSRVALESASLSIKTGTPPLLIRQDDRSYIAEWTMAEAMLLELQLVSKIGGLKSKPYFLPIGLLKDRAPRVALRHSGVGRRVTATARIPITVRATDDFVLTSLGIDIQQLSIQEEKTQQRESRLIATPDGYDPEKTPESELEHQTSLSLASLGATVPSVIRLRASAVDNCAAGQQTGQSRWIAFQVVSRDELFYEILMRQRAQRRVFEQAVKSAEKQSVKLASTLSADQIGPILRKHQILSRRVLQIATRLDATLLEMTLNDLGNSKSNELLSQEIIAPIRELHAAEISDVRVQLEIAANHSDDLSLALDTARRQHRSMVKKMKQILARMSQWESFVDVTNQLEKIMKIQKEAMKAAQKLRDKKIDDLFDD